MLERALFFVGKLISIENSDKINFPKNSPNSKFKFLKDTIQDKPAVKFQCHLQLDADVDNQ